MSPPDREPSENLSDAPLSWATLLASWTDFAKAAVALPRDAEGERWRAAVPAVIDLQATIHALSELDRLPASRRPAAIETAEALVTDRARRLEADWDGRPPESIVELIRDAHSAVAAARASLD